MRIGIVTDEISPNVAEAISLGVSWGIQDFEFRTSASGRVPYVSEQDIEDLRDCQKKYGIRITALSPGTFKVPLEDESAVEKELQEVLPATIELAHKLQIRNVITFGFLRSPSADSSSFDRLVEVFGKAADLARREEITLAVENEPGFWADSGKRTARLLATVNSEHLKANWDPANALGAENYPFPVGYEALKRWVVNVHVKDVKKNAAIECVPIGDGMINWEGQLRALVRDRQVEHVTIETHCLPLIEKSKQNVETVKKMLQKIQQETSTNRKTS